MLISPGNVSLFASSAQVTQMELSVEHNRRDNAPVNILSRWIRQDNDDDRNELVLNILLLGSRQSGRSSVGNALIGGREFQTGVCMFGDSITTEHQVLRRNYPRTFRRQGAECDLTLRVIDTPPLLPQQRSVHDLCPDGVHVFVLVVRLDLPRESARLEQHMERLFGPEWRRHVLLVLTYADHLKKAGLPSADYLKQASDWLRALAAEVKGGVLFLDNSCDWPLIRGQPLRDRILNLSARNHHQALKVRMKVPPTLN